MLNQDQSRMDQRQAQQDQNASQAMIVGGVSDAIGSAGGFIK